MDKNFFLSKKKAEELLNGKILAVVTEYTIFKLDLMKDQVMFRCLLDEYTFSVFFETIRQELHTTDNDLQQFFWDALVTYCSVNIQRTEKRTYPIGEFNNHDELLDWFLIWKSCSEEERLDFIENS